MHHFSGVDRVRAARAYIAASLHLGSKKEKEAPLVVTSGASALVFLRERHYGQPPPAIVTIPIAALSATKLMLHSAE